MAFEKDLGYLSKFFDNLEAHAATLDPAIHSRLVTLIGEERVRWNEITDLLAGKATIAKSTADTGLTPAVEPIENVATGRPPKATPIAAVSGPAPPGPPGSRLTVGTLISQ